MVVYHVWLGRVSGGVDAFLMISAFFLTGTFVRRLERGSPLRVPWQWVRTFKRLLPPAAAVLIAVLAIGAIVLPASSLPDLWQHSWASLFYAENWLLAFESVDYYADTSLASPVQHFWSLSVQGQVFLLWPLLFGIVALLGRLLSRATPRALSIAVFGTVFATSLTYSILSTAADQRFAYFDTGARLWEFAAGSLLALLLPYLRLPGLLAGFVGWLVLDVQGGFPGYLALWPVLSVAAVIASGAAADTRYGPARLLASKPLRLLGHDAYGLYLVHWPLLVFTLIVRDGEPLGFAWGALLILVSILLARLLTWGVDDHFRGLPWGEKSPLRGLVIVIASLLVVATPLGLWQTQTEREATALREAQQAADQSAADAREAYRDHPGARALLPDWDLDPSPGAPILPLPIDLDREWGSLSGTCTDLDLEGRPEALADCGQNNASRAAQTLLVIGDSHAEQWLEPLEPIADRGGWRIVSLLRGGCPLGLREVEGDDDGPYGADCRAWNEAALDFAEELQPDAVLTIGTSAREATRGEEGGSAGATGASGVSGSGERETVVDGLPAAIEVLAGHGVPVILIRDNPRFDFDPFVCLEQEDDPAECAVDRSEALARVNPLRELTESDVAGSSGAGSADESSDSRGSDTAESDAEGSDRSGSDRTESDSAESDTATSGIAVIDMSDFICPRRECPAVIGNVSVYRDDNHLSTSYTASMEEMLEPRLLEAFESLNSSRAPSARSAGAGTPPV